MNIDQSGQIWRAVRRSGWNGQKMEENDFMVSIASLLKFSFFSLFIMLIMCQPCIAKDKSWSRVGVWLYLKDSLRPILRSEVSAGRLEECLATTQDNGDPQERLSRLPLDNRRNL